MPKLKYTEKQRLETLQILMKFDGDMKKTAAFTGIPYRTIQYWTKHNIVKQALENPEENYSKEVTVMVSDIEAKVQDLEKELIPKLYQSINKTVEKGNFLLNQETDLNKVSNFLKTLSEAANIIKPPSQQGGSNLTQFIQMINNQYVGNK